MMHTRRIIDAALIPALVLTLLASLIPLAAGAQALSPATRAQLQDQLNQLDAQASEIQKQIDALATQKASLARDTALLDAQIADSKLAIKRRNLAITQLSTNIQSKQDTISGLNDQLQNEYESLAAILREWDKLDRSSVVVAALTAQSLSEFFADATQFSAINENMQASFTSIRTNKQVNEEQKSNLEDQLAEQTRLREAQQLQQASLQAQEAQKKKLIEDTKGKESNYQAVLNANKKTAAQIRAALFNLSGSKSIPFETALEYAELAGQQTGIRPAFLLGIIREESNLGENVGTGTWMVDMHPTRDRPIFAAIAASLGLDPDRLPVSKKAWYGWGGAMGPAQFIPSTWALYAGYPKANNYAYDPSKDRVGKLTGNKPASPWEPKDAFMAAALYLTDSGAGLQTKSAEFKAAMCYLAGCGQVNNKSLQFYGNDVAKFANEYQCQIDILKGNPGSSSC